ncbi:MAG: glycosyltransferase family 1 protein [Parvularculaceae bacterium]|nr:glycosyltransferase family 1 protein [Parvularculaceae bacterium]
MRNAAAIIAPPSAEVPARAPLRVALFSGNYNYVIDGPVRALNKLVAHLEARGHQALVLAPTTRKPALRHAGELISVPSVALPGSRREYRLGLGISAAARKRLEAFAPTIIHVAAPDWLGLAALNYARDKGLPVVASFHTRFDTYPRYYGMAWLEKHVTGYMRYFYRRCTRVYAPSESMVEELRRDGIGRDIRLWERGVDHELFNPLRRDMAWRRNCGFADEDVVVAFVGRVVLEKGIDVFAAAVREASESDPNIRALVVGDGPVRERFEEMLPDAVFAGFLQGEDLARAYASADIFFNPSVTETFGNVTLEAMASGLPSICAAASGSRSLVQHGETGFLLSDARNARGFASALQSLARDPAQRMRMGSLARTRSAAFEWSAILDRLITDYQDIVATTSAAQE